MKIEKPNKKELEILIGILIDKIIDYNKKIEALKEKALEHDILNTDDSDCPYSPDCNDSFTRMILEVFRK